MKIYPKIYKRNKKGGIEQWQAEIDPLGGETYKVIYGKLGGKLQEKFTEVYSKNIGKINETSIQEQCILEVDSLYKSQKDKGYIELIDLYLKSNSTFHDEPTNEQLLKFLEEWLPLENSDANGNVKPMLAHKVKEDYSNVVFPCIAQPKLDGFRSLLIIENSKIEFISRSGKEFITLNHIKESIINSEWYQLNKDTNYKVILDGELYADTNILTFQEISSAIKKFSKDSTLLKFRCYDIISNNLQKDRDKEVTSIITNINSDYIQGVATFLCYDINQIQSNFAIFIEAGYEGAMIRLLEGKYESGFRSHSLLKLKEFDEDEFKFIEFNLGDRGTEDLILVCKTKEGKEFRAKSMGTKEYKKKLHERENLILLQSPNVTIKYFGFTTDLIPRFPIAKIINRDQYE